MTEAEINIKIAEWMGLECYKTCINYYVIGGECCEDNCKANSKYKPLDYCDSLDLVWEVEEKLKADGIFTRYINEINYMIMHYIMPYDDSFSTYNAYVQHLTAKQCCEAIIKILENI